MMIRRKGVVVMLVGTMVAAALVLSGCPSPVASIDDVEDLELPDTVSVEVGETVSLEVTILPEDLDLDVDDVDLVWESSDSDIAEVDQDGEVTGVAEGSATITVALEDDEDISASTEVTVEDADDDDENGVQDVEGLELQAATVETGETVTLEVSVLPEDLDVDVDDLDLVWESSDTDIAEVDEDGVVTGVFVEEELREEAPDSDNLVLSGDFEHGLEFTDEATITVELADDEEISASADVTVEDPIWELWSHDEASTVEVEDGEAKIDIASIEGDWWSVQFQQFDIDIPEEGKYTLSLTAWADDPRDVQVQLVPPGIDPPQFQFALGDSEETYEATVDFTDWDGTLSDLNVGMGTVSENSKATTVHIDEVSLSEQDEALDTSELTVNVTGEGNGPIEGATVELTGGFAGTTDVDGEAVFELENRQYQLEVGGVAAEGYAPADMTVVLEDDKTVNVELEELEDPTEQTWLYWTDEGDVPDDAVQIDLALDTWGTETIQEPDYDEDDTYSPAMRLEYVDGWGIVFATGIDAGTLHGYDTLHMKVKTDDYDMVVVSLPGAEAEPHEMPHQLADGEDLDDGWVQMEIDLEEYGELTAVNEFGVHNNEGAHREEENPNEGNEILLTDIYFDIDED